VANKNSTQISMENEPSPLLNQKINHRRTHIDTD